MNAVKKSSKVQVGLATLLGLGAAALMATASSDVDAAVNEVSAACSNANVVLAGGFAAGMDSEWAKVRQFFANKRVWQVVATEGGPDGFELGVAGKVQYRQWDVTARTAGGPEVVATVHCGAGGTCNEIGKLWAAEYKDQKPGPYLWCGDFHSVLGNPQPVAP